MIQRRRDDGEAPPVSQDAATAKPKPKPFTRAELDAFTDEEDDAACDGMKAPR
jgi:hypothetical protein